MRDFGVVGMGYVGLPLALSAVEKGATGVGLDASATVVQGLLKGESHVDDLSNRDIRNMLDSGFAFTDDARELAGTRAVLICVPTPLGDEGGPDLGAVRSATESVRDNMVPGTRDALSRRLGRGQRTRS